MVFVEVITEFKVEHFDIIKQKIPLENVLLITTDLTIQEKAEQQGYNVMWFDEYFGYSNSKIYSLYEKAIKNMTTLKKVLDEVKYKNTSLVDGLKFQILFNFVFLEEIKSIFEEKKNVIFLLPNTEYYFFSIIHIAKEIGYQTKFGISNVVESDLISLKFDETKASDSRFLYYDTRFLYEKLEDQESPDATDEKYVKEISDILSKIEFSEAIEPKTGFFLNNNEADFYLKPVYPVLEKFIDEKTEFIIFTTYPRATEQISERGYKSYDLSEHINKLFPIMLKRNYEIILDFIDKAKLCSNDNLILKSYLKCLKNDAISRALTRILSLISIIDHIFKKFKFKSVVVGLDGTPDNDLVCSVARNYNITTYSIMPTMLTENHNPIFGVVFNADKLLLPGTKFKEELEELDVDGKRLVVTGSPRYDYINNKSQNDKPELKNLKLTAKNGLIIVAMSRWHKNDEEWLSDLIHFCDKKNFDILIKPHPMYQSIHKEISNMKIEKISEKCKGLRYYILYDIELREILPYASILITEHSTVGIEASLNNVPIIVVNIQNEDYFKQDFTMKYNEEKIALYATTVPDLFDCIIRISDMPYKIVTMKTLQNEREKFNYKINYLNDGKSSDRIFHILTNV